MVDIRKAEVYDVCGGCRKVLYCGQKCKGEHWDLHDHRAACYDVIKARLEAGDVDKDDVGGEWVLKDCVETWRKEYGGLDARTLVAIIIMGCFCIGLENMQRRCFFI